MTFLKSCRHRETCELICPETNVNACRQYHKLLRIEHQNDSCSANGCDEPRIGKNFYCKKHATEQNSKSTKNCKDDSCAEPSCKRPRATGWSKRGTIMYYTLCHQHQIWKRMQKSKNLPNRDVQITFEQAEKVMDNDCYCGMPGPSRVDKINSLDCYRIGNIQPLCEGCNRGKTFWPDEIYKDWIDIARDWPEEERKIFREEWNRKWRIK